MNAKVAKKIRKGLRKEAQSFRDDLYRLPFKERLRIAWRLLCPEK